MYLFFIEGGSVARLAHGIAQQVKTVVSLPAGAVLPIAHQALALGGGVENIPSGGEHADGKRVLGIAEEAVLSKQGFELNMVQYRLVFDSLKLPTALLSIRLVPLISQAFRNVCSLNT